MSHIQELKSVAQEVLTEELTKEYFELLRIKSVSNPALKLHDEVENAADYLVSIMKKRRILAEKIPNSPHSFVVGYLEVDPRLPTVLNYCHFDVQPASKEDPGVAWVTDPFDPKIVEEEVVLHDGSKIDDKRIYGRGTVDDKGPLMTHLWTLDSYSRAGIQPPVNMLFIFEGTEEYGDEGGLEAYIKENARTSLRADLATILDGICHRTGIPIINTTLRGIIGIHYRIETGSNSVHSGLNSGNLVPNPLEIAVNIWKDLKGNNGEIKIPNFYDGSRRITLQEIAELERLGFDKETYLAKTGLKYVKAEGGEALERLWHRPTLELHGISPFMNGSIIPPYAEVKLTIRTVEGQDNNKIASEVKEAIENSAIRNGIPIELLDDCLKITTVPGLPAFRENPDNEYLKRMDRALRNGYNVEDLHYIGCGGSVPQAWAIKTHLGCPVIVTGIAEPGSNYHGNNENVLVNLGLRNGIFSYLEFYEGLREAHKKE